MAVLLLAVLLLAAADGFIFNGQVNGGEFISGSIDRKLQINLNARQRMEWQGNIQSIV